MTSTTLTLRTFDANYIGRDFIVGDIHGHFEALEALIANARFDCSTDRLFVTGDLVDRGPYSNLVMDWLNKPWFHSVRGNHEQMAIDAIAGRGNPDRHARNGGSWFYQCSGAQKNKIVARLEEMPMAIELKLRNNKTVGIIHAELPGWEHGLSWQQGIELLVTSNSAEQPDAANQALYSRTRINRHDDQLIKGLDRLFVGHSTVPEVLHLGNVVYMDTGCSFSDGKLSAIDLLTNEITSINMTE